jgi:hypothetical protein
MIEKPRRCEAVMKTMRGAIWTLTAMLGVACSARTAETGGAAASSGSLSYVGQVAVAGTAGANVTTIFVDGRGSVGIVGALEPEVRALSGARLRVEGPAGTGFPGESVDVRSYEVLEVNGARPYVGVLANTPQGLALEQVGGERLSIAGGPNGLAANVGAKVWLTGTLDAGRLQVQSYGVIRSR